MTSLQLPELAWAAFEDLSKYLVEYGQVARYSIGHVVDDVIKSMADHVAGTEVW